LPPAQVAQPRRRHMIRLPLRRRAVLRRFALRRRRHDVVRRGWLAAILLLFLARSLPLGKQRKCFGGLTIRGFGCLSPVAFPTTSLTPTSPAPFLDQISARPSECGNLTLALAGKEREGVGAVIEEGPNEEGRLGAAWGAGAHPDPGSGRPGVCVERASAPGISFLFGKSDACSGSGKPESDPPHVVCSGSSGPLGLPPTRVPAQALRWGVARVAG
jgi:hypothetical protein